MTESTRNIDQEAIDSILILTSNHGAAPDDKGSLAGEIYDLALNAKTLRDHPNAMSLGRFLNEGYPDPAMAGRGRVFPGGGKIEDPGDGTFIIKAGNATKTLNSDREAERQLWVFLVKAGMI